MRLEGKVAFISGGARGMGAEEALLFAAEGARVVIGDVLEEAGQRLAESINETGNETGGQARFVALDVTSEAQWQQAIAVAAREFGGLDILVNNAGIGGAPASEQRATQRSAAAEEPPSYLAASALRMLVEHTTEAEWDRTMDINAKGVFLGTKAAIPELRRRGGGSIINISSQLGLVGVDNSSPQYLASKGAVRLLTKSTAIQYAREGIRCNSVHPGPIVTPMTEAGRADAERYRVTVGRVPLGRYGEPREVAYGVLFLASDESSFMTGSELVIDGGWTAQ